MNSSLELVAQIIDLLNPALKKTLSPHLIFEKQKQPYLDESYHQLNLLDKIDPSHLSLLFQEYQKKDLNLLVNSLQTHPPTQLKGYITALTFKRLNRHYKTVPYRYLSSFKGEKVLLLNHVQLKSLIHLLGVYDIKLFLKSCIDQKLITQIHEALSQTEQAFLASIQSEPDKVTFKKMPLESWQKDQQSFEALKYTRGLNRLAKAVALESVFIKQEIILRLPLNDKATFLSLATPLEPVLHDTLYKPLQTALDWLETQALKHKPL
jgi:hypothetical protein